MSKGKINLCKFGIHKLDVEYTSLSGYRVSYCLHCGKMIIL